METGRKESEESEVYMTQNSFVIYKPIGCMREREEHHDLSPNSLSIMEDMCSTALCPWNSTFNICRICLAFVLSFHSYITLWFDLLRITDVASEPMVDTILDIRQLVFICRFIDPIRISWFLPNPIQKGVALVSCKQITIAYQKIVWGIFDINLQLVMHVNRIVIISGSHWDRTPVLLYTGLF